MQRLKTTHVSPSEWRWVFIFGGILAVITLLPYAWALGANASAAEWQFMGVLANPQDGASYLAKIAQGTRGAWLLKFMHTPDPHTGAGIQTFYPLLGHVANLAGLSNVVIFHLARIVTTLFMFSALYQLGATIWARQRPRRLFFTLTALGSGLGWLVLLIDPSITDVPDLVVPEAYPFYAAFANPHFPLTIGALALIAATYLDAFRIDAREEPSVTNGGLTIFLLALIVALVLPQALVPLGGTLAVYLVFLALKQRRLPVLELRWVSMLFLPSILMAAYFYAVVTYNPIMQAWNLQITNPSASPWLVIAGYGVLVIVALPGLVRAVRRFEADGDQFMLVWLVVNLLLVFLPFNHQRRFMIGLIMPITFFAVRSLEDFWFARMAQRWHGLATVLLVVLILPSNVLAMGIPLFGLMNPEAGLDQRLLVEHGYWEAMTWLDAHGTSDEVVLASPNPALWVPAYGNKRVVYGHPYETIDGPARQAQVLDWYSGAECYWPTDAQDGYHITYVLQGPQEQALATGESACEIPVEAAQIERLEWDGVTLYILGD